MPEYQGTADQNTITFHVNARDHNNEQGFYSTHIYAWDENGGVSKAFLDPVLLSEVASKGDLNADGKVDIMDARKAKRAAMKEITLTESEFAAADLNGDGKVDIMEARKIKRAAMKEITLWWGCGNDEKEIMDNNHYFTFGYNVFIVCFGRRERYASGNYG